MTAYAKVFVPAPNTNVNGNNLLNTNSNVLNGNQGMIRIDQRFGNNNTLTGRFNINDSHNIQPTALPAVNNTVGKHVHQRDDQRYPYLRGTYCTRFPARLPP